MKYHNYRCPKNCHVRVSPVYKGGTGDRCPRCGEWMLHDGEKEVEEIQKKTVNLQIGD